MILASVRSMIVAPVSQGQASDRPAAQTPPDNRSASNDQVETPDGSQLLDKAQREGAVRVIVGLRTDFAPEGRLSRPEVADQRDGIQSAQAGLQEDLQGTGYRTVREFDTIPFVALELPPQALQAVQRSPLVTDIFEDRPEEAYQEKSASEDPDSPQLAESTPLVQAPTMWANGFTGSGQTIAVLDTGVDRTHPFLSGKVVEEACYSGNSNCPNGSTSQTGTGSGVHCTYAPSGCRHGTHVAGIAAGQGSSFSGVAKGADVMAVQVFSRFTGSTNCGSGEDPCTLTYTSDQIAGLERVYALRSTRNFSSVNMSLGGGRYYSNCDAEQSARKAVIDNLRSAGIPTVIASGNSYYTDSMGAPACISSAVSVGSTTESDTVSSFSNSASFLSLLAPGSSINSSVPGGGYAVFNGTSMATPHVAGAWALLKQKTPSASVSSLLSSLQGTGQPVTDTRVAGGVTKPRIRIADAAVTTAPTVASSAPVPEKTGVSRKANVTAAFSEEMNVDTLNKYNITLYKGGTSTPVSARVTPSASGSSVTLNPYASTTKVLAKNAWYQAVIWKDPSGVKDKDGNPLAGSGAYLESSSGEYVYWWFKTKSR